MPCFFSVLLLLATVSLFTAFKYYVSSMSLTYCWFYTLSYASKFFFLCSLCLALFCFSFSLSLSLSIMSVFDFRSSHVWFLQVDVILGALGEGARLIEPADEDVAFWERRAAFSLPNLLSFAPPSMLRPSSPLLMRSFPALVLVEGPIARSEWIPSGIVRVVGDGNSWSYSAAAVDGSLGLARPRCETYGLGMDVRATGRAAPTILRFAMTNILLFAPPTMIRSSSPSMLLPGPGSMIVCSTTRAQGVFRQV